MRKRSQLRKAKNTTAAQLRGITKKRARPRKVKNTEAAHQFHCQPQPPQTQTSSNGRLFFGCYLLTSLSPRYKGHSYIGFTVNPKRRIRQHNGEITSGAFSTKKKRPWEMVFCIHGFPTHIAALQFEWAWQHPKESLAVREAAATFKTLGGLANKIKLALTMVTLPSWHSMDLTVSFFSTKYMEYAAGCPSLPHQMKLHFCSMDELPCYSLSDQPFDNSHHDEEDFESAKDFCDLSDGTQLSLLDGSEVNCFSIDIQSKTLQKTSPDKTAWEQRGIVTPESSSMVDNAALEGSTQPLRLLPVPSGAHGSAGNCLNEQVQIIKEIWHKDLPGSFCQTDPSTEFLFCIPEEHIRPFCLSPTGDHGSGQNSEYERQNSEYELLQLSKEITSKRRRNSFCLQEEYIGESVHQIDPVFGESSPMDDHVTIVEKHAEKDEMTHVLINESMEKQIWQTDETSPTRVADTDHKSSMEGIEVIDLFTPSPDCRIIEGRRKRRAACDSPDIIDLTRSPLFVQL